ncbi:MAG: pirin family protein [Acidobacteriota bacterium]|nr:pirin family protein [Acidobacteriota bacterium]
MTKQKKVQGVFENPPQHWVGDGFHVRSVLPRGEMDGRFSPFLLLDYAGPTQFQPTRQPRGVGAHPHRGFETVTIVYQGALEHRDSAGNAGGIGPGDVQWMTAAAGLLHEEKHAAEFSRAGGTLEMVQLWVNLPKARKGDQPGYQTLLNSQIPVVDFGGGSFGRVIAGDVKGVHGPAKTATPLTVVDLQFQPGGVAEFDLPERFNTALLLLHGEVTVNGATEMEGAGTLALFDHSGATVRVEARTKTSALLLSGEPIDEPVAAAGPFVMNTREELQQAMRDFSAH